VAFTTAPTGRNTYSTIDVAASLHKQSCTRVGTGRLNQALQQALAAHKPGARRGRKAARFFYGTQVSTRPPTIVLFVNGPELIKRGYERFLVNRLRETLPFSEIPIRLLFRARRRAESKHGQRS
jgi:GTP-binding protein